MTAIRFATFANSDGPWLGAAGRLARQAVKSGVFEKVEIVTEATLASQYPKDFQKVLDLSRQFPQGFGLWSWKSLVARYLLETSKRGTSFTYIDAGSTLNFSTAMASLRFQTYVETANEQGGLFFQQNLVERDWSSPQLLEHFKDYPTIASSGQLLGGIWMLLTNSRTKFLIDSWWDYSIRDQGALLIGSPIASNLPIPHRHDQSILSCLAKREGFPSIPDETYFGPDWELFGKNYPIWATRLRLPFDNAHRFSYFWRTLRVLERKIR
jgi:hypothetical protein